MKVLMVHMSIYGDTRMDAQSQWHTEIHKSNDCVCYRRNTDGLNNVRRPKRQILGLVWTYQ